MQYRALVTDYDDTLTSGKHLDPETVAALRRLRATGRKIVLVTGQPLIKIAGPNGLLSPEDQRLFDRIVAEDGAVMLTPTTGVVRLLGPPPSAQLVARLADEGVRHVKVGCASISVRIADVGSVVRALADEPIAVHAIQGAHHVVFVGRGVNKATGMRAALGEMGLTGADAVVIGNGPNDVDMLDPRQNGGALAFGVANATPAVRNLVSDVTRGETAAGVRELITALVTNDVRRGGLSGVAA